MTPQETHIFNAVGLLLVGGGGLWMYLWPAELARTYKRIWFRSDDVTLRSITWVRRLGMLEMVLVTIGIVDWFLESIVHLNF
jgi:hypothetical protein